MKQILVLGSLNIDLVQRLPCLPRAGETLSGSDLQIFVGGKGANQACAAARLGGNAAMAGMVGTDGFADQLIEQLQECGVDTQRVHRVEGASGSASVFVLPNGENAIALSPGANAKVKTEFALSQTAHLQAGDFLLCQLETPLPAVQAALQAAHRQEVVTILDPAPACHLPDELLKSVAILTPNQTEAAFLIGETSIPKSMAEAAAVAGKLRARGAVCVIVKMGELGCLMADDDAITAIPAYPIAVVDTTAAGDTFNGALAVALSEGFSRQKAARFANAAAALSVSKAGAIKSLPTRAQVNQFLSGRGEL